MATFSHPRFAAPSFQGNYDLYGAGPNGDVRLLPISLNVTAAQLANGNVFNMIKLNDRTTVVGGWLVTDNIDSHGTPTIDLDVGYDLDSGTDDPDFFFDGSATAYTSGGYNENFIAGIGTAAAPFIPTDEYFVTVTVSAAAATAADGTITLNLLIADASDYEGDAE